VTNNATVGGTLAVTGAGSFSSTLSSGAATLASATVTNNATVGGTLGVTGAATFSSTLSSGAATLASVGVTNNATVGGTLGVTGIATFDAEVDALAFATTSDARLKKDVVEVVDALAKVKALRPVEYNWISSANLNPSCKELGFIAQEVEEVVPAVVATGDDADATKRVAYDRLTSLLVAAVKEQSAVIEALQARVAALESRA